MSARSSKFLQKFGVRIVLSNSWNLTNPCKLSWKSQSVQDFPKKSDILHRFLATAVVTTVDSPKKEEDEMIRLLMRKDCAAVIRILRNLQERRIATVFAYNVALNAYAIMREADHALKTFEDLQKDTNGGADRYSYGCLTSALCRAGRVDEAVSLLNKMVEHKLRPNIIIMNTLLHGAVTVGRIDLANWIRVVIREEGLVINEMTLIGAVRLAALRTCADDVTKAWIETVQIMAHSKVRCSHAAIAALAVAYSQCDEPDLAVQAIHILCRALQENPEIVSPYMLFAAAGKDILSDGDERIHKNTLNPDTSDRLIGRGHGEHFTSSQEVLDSEKNSTLVSSRKIHIQAAFGSAANAYSRAGKDSAVQKVLKLLEIVGGFPYAPAIIAQIKGLVGRELSNKRKKNFRISEPDYSSRTGSGTRIDDLISKELFRSGFRPTNELYNALLREQARLGGLSAAVAQWNLMTKEQVPFVPDVYSFGTLLAAHAAEMDVDGAWETWSALKDAKIIPDEACLVSLISAHARRNKSSSADPRALQIIMELRKLGRSHTVATGTAMSRVLGHLGMAKEAFEVIQELRESGYKISTRSFNTLLHVINDCRLDIFHSISVFRDMIHNGCGPDKNSYNALISNTLQLSASGSNFDSDPAHSLAGRLSAFFLAFMISSGVRPETDTFNVSIKSAIFSNRLSMAKELIQEMKVHGVHCNEHTIFTILNAERWSNSSHLQQEINWILEESIKLGARPRQQVVFELIRSALGRGDLAQAVWYLGLCVTYRLVHPNLSLEIIQNIDAKVQNS